MTRRLYLTAILTVLLWALPGSGHHPTPLTPLAPDASLTPTPLTALDIPRVHPLFAPERDATHRS